MASRDDKSATPKSGDKAADKKTTDRPRAVRVKAIRKGYYGEMLRPIGMIFNVTLRHGDKLPSWVEPFDDEAPVSPPAADQTSPDSGSKSSDEVI